MTDGKERSDGRLEVASAIVLAVAALGSSWASYQAGLWDGEQAANYSRANSLRVEASRSALSGAAMAQVQIAMFGAWLDAKANNDDNLARFYQARFTPGLKPSFNAWLAERPLANSAAPATPFSMPSYRAPGQVRAGQFDREADAAFAEGQRANTVSDGFEQGATILALALFFGGIGQVFRTRGARIGLLAVAVLVTAAGLLRVASLPLQSLGL